VEHVKAERNVLAEVHNPYIVKLYYSFQVKGLAVLCSLQWFPACKHMKGGGSSTLLLPGLVFSTQLKPA